MRIIRTATFLKYARLKIQEAENALQEEEIGLAVQRCKDAVVCLIKAVAAASERWKREEITPGIDAERLRKIVSDVIASDELSSICSGMGRVLAAQVEGNMGNRIEAEQFLALTGELFSQIHTSLYPQSI